MTRYIDADALYRHMVSVHKHWKELSDTQGIIPTVDDEVMILHFPTADVRENVHGEWVVKDESYWRPHYSGAIQVNKAGLYCSECNKRLATAQKYKSFCPNCGADMRERREDVSNC